MKTLLQRDVVQPVRDRLGALRPDSLGQWGRMSAHQAVCHLADAFRLVLGERPTDGRGNLLMRTVIRFVALTLPVAWPKIVAPAPEMTRNVAEQLHQSSRRTWTRLRC